jgi:hypothetical protein
MEAFQVDERRLVMLQNCDELNELQNEVLTDGCPECGGAFTGTMIIKSGDFMVECCQDHITIYGVEYFIAGVMRIGPQQRESLISFLKERYEL